MQLCAINARLPTHTPCAAFKHGDQPGVFSRSLVTSSQRGWEACNQSLPHPQCAPTHMQISGPSKPFPLAPSAPRKNAKASPFKSRRSPKQLRLLCSAGKSGLDTSVVSFLAEGGAQQTVPDACASGLACRDLHGLEIRPREDH